MDIHSHTLPGQAGKSTMKNEHLQHIILKRMDEQEGNTSCLGGSSQDGRYCDRCCPQQSLLWLVTWVVPSNSQHQDCYIFCRGSQPKPSFATITGMGDSPTYNHLLTGMILQAWFWVLDFCQFSTPTHKSTDMKLGFWDSVRKWVCEILGAPCSSLFEAIYGKGLPRNVHSTFSWE